MSVEDFINRADCYHYYCRGLKDGTRTLPRVQVATYKYAVRYGHDEQAALWLGKLVKQSGKSIQQLVKEKVIDDNVGVA